MIALWLAAALAQTRAEVPTENLPMLMEVVSADGPVVLLGDDREDVRAARALSSFTKVPFRVRRLGRGEASYAVGSALLKTRSRCAVALDERGRAAYDVVLHGDCDDADLRWVATAHPSDALSLQAFDLEVIRRQRGAARAEMWSGVGVTAAGLALIAGTAMVAADARHIDKAPWTAMVVTNSLGWVAAGTGVVVTLDGRGRLARGRNR